MSTEAAEKFLYEQIAAKITELIRTRTLEPGDRLPSVRSMSRNEKVSISTVLQAYYWLEGRGLIEAHPQSGFYVKLRPSKTAPEPEMSSPAEEPGPVGVEDLINEVLVAASNSELIPLGAAMPSTSLFPNKKLVRILYRMAKINSESTNRYDQAPGYSELRRQLARRSLSWGGVLSADEIVVTLGCTEALNLCLRAVTRPGDTVAVESPTYFAVLNCMQMLGIRALEIATHPSKGICLDSLEQALQRHQVKAVLVMPNCHNPLGACMPESKKKRLVDMITAHRVALIEDDVYGDLSFEVTRPRPAKVFDTEGWVLLCSSFSKTLAPGYRLGWVAPGRFLDKVTRLKRMSTFGNPMVTQMMLAEYLKSGNYDHHLRRLRKQYAAQIEQMRCAVARFFPGGTRMTQPTGGLVLWVEFPGWVDSLQLYRRALAEDISIAPGPLFSPNRGFRNFIRLNCGLKWNDDVMLAIRTLGRLSSRLTEEQR